MAIPVPLGKRHLLVTSPQLWPRNRLRIWTKLQRLNIRKGKEFDFPFATCSSR